jgi:hypothetical protein
MTAEEICQAVADHTISVAKGLSLLEKSGYEVALAEEQIWIALGGDDVVLDDEQRQRNDRASRALK